MAWRRAKIQVSRRVYDLEPADVGSVQHRSRCPQVPFRAPSPAGWPDRASHWAAPDAIMKRLEWSQLLAERLGNRERPEAMLAGSLGPAASAQTLRAVRSAESQAQGLVLALMSPEFQRR
ncbi:MAG: DUF1800 family protein [Betaproteobacteria bacterium]|nr:DUF1800 family protein [Betaproteobacteria bacterium]